MELTYDKIEELLPIALPELRPAVEYYWQVEGQPGEDCGAYNLFEDLFGDYLNVLMAMESSPGRDRLLKRAFAFTEEMLGCSDDSVANLAYISLYEWQVDWWRACAEPFIGPNAIAVLDQFDPTWGEYSPDARPTEEEKAKLYDQYGVRAIIASELASEGVSLADVPGHTHLME